jgi:hypothetical protein
MSPPTLDDLGLPGAVYLWALLHAQKYRVPIAPTTEAVNKVLAVLEEQQVIMVAPEPPGRGDKITPLEGIRWRWTWAAYPADGAVPALEDYFASFLHDEQAVELGLALWRRLIVAESQAFYAQQLARCQFDVQWQADMEFAQRLGGMALSIAQWRYCAWAAVRQGASVACQKAMPAEHIREAMYRELTRRAAALAAGRYGNCAFPPEHELPATALARGFANLWFDLGKDYWCAIADPALLRKSYIARTS